MEDKRPHTEIPSTPATEEGEAIAFAEFLESVPPSQTRKIPDLVGQVPVSGDSSNVRYYQVSTPEILIHCPHPSCNGPRFYRFTEDRSAVVNDDSYRAFYMNYRCGNCRDMTKIFSLMAIVITDRGTRYGECFKLGELPVYGPPTPSRLISLIGPDREMFLNGRRCENQGLGIGAFVYYRRVVENQKARILGEIIKVSEKIGAPPELIETLSKAKAETQFKRAVDSVRDALPQILLINGQNPLTLLHSALSEGLHAQTDAACLALAHAVRVVLTELSDRLGQALKDEAELRSAISLLTKPSAVC
jgi:hypothetical protein